MVVAMRFARWGRKNRPFFRLVVADQRMPRDGRHLEKLGTLDPLPTSDGQKIASLNFARIQLASSCCRHCC
jgi:small subunit ribosomal protein S16